MLVLENCPLRAASSMLDRYSIADWWILFQLHTWIFCSALSPDPPALCKQYCSHELGSWGDEPAVNAQFERLGTGDLWATNPVTFHPQHPIVSMLAINRYALLACGECAFLGTCPSVVLLVNQSRLEPSLRTKLPRIKQT